MQRMNPAKRMLDALNPGRRRRALAPFPDTFLFGAGTSDHQCEAYDPAHEDIWDLWERADPRHRTARGRATDFWNRWEEDVDLAHALGCNAFRFSVSWARVEPEPGRYDDAAFAHYRRMVDGIRARGMAPVVTLMHFTWPLHIERAGSLMADTFPGAFSRYAAEAAQRLGDGVRWWITINEPNLLPFGFIRPWWQRHDAVPPGCEGISGDTQLKNSAAVVRNLFRAHAYGREALREVLPAARVGVNPFILGLPPTFQTWLDMHTEKSRAPGDWERREGRMAGESSGLRRLLEYPSRFMGVFSTMLNTNWWYLGMAGKLPGFLCPPDCVKQLDFVGLDYYWGIPTLRFHQLFRLLDSLHQRYRLAPVHPRGLLDVLHRYAEMFPGLPIVVIENGSVESADSVSRASYLRRHVREVQLARMEGAPVVGYLSWSITSNREWGLPFGPESDFGLYHIELDKDPALARHTTAAAEAYRRIIQNRGA